MRTTPLSILLYASASPADRAGGVGFGAAGVDFTRGAAALRLEGRENIVSCAAPTADGMRSTHNDLGLALGLAFHPHGL